ncbi:MAG: LptE family protein [Deltaproteobacteria bacterium]|nr:LptE family protein [Deltaproteobacteria bacterium]
MRPARGYIFLLLAAFILGGCGYYIAGRGGRMPGGIERLAIPVFANETHKPDIEAAVTTAFVREMVNNVDVAPGADAVMTGVIKSYTLTPVSFTKSDVNIEYRLTVALSLRITRDGMELWREDNVVDYEDFTVNTSDVAATRDAERAALEKLAKDTARIVKERMVSAF